MRGHRFRLAVLSLALLAACTDEHDAKRAVEASGHTNVVVGDYVWFGCGEGEYGWEFRATTPQGVAVRGLACCGQWAKACTMRFR